MFRDAKNPTKLKKVVYLFAATFLGVLLSFLVHAFIELNYLNWAERNNYAVTFYGGCALPFILQTTLWVAGIIGGFLLGRLWWQKVYVDRVWAKKIGK